MTRALDDLSSVLKPKIFELLARLVERGVYVMIVDILRTQAECDAALANGTSWTKHSKHLPRKLRGFAATDPDAEKSDAIDLCPYETYALHGPDKLNWNPADPAWLVIGQEGERLGLRWGGRWVQQDMGHLEIPNP